MKLIAAVFAAALMCVSASAQEKMYVTAMGAPPSLGALLPAGLYLPGPETILVSIESQDTFRVTVKFHKPDGSVGEITQDTEPWQKYVSAVNAWFKITPADFIEARARKLGPPIVANGMGGPFVASTAVAQSAPQEAYEMHVVGIGVPEDFNAGVAVERRLPIPPGSKQILAVGFKTDRAIIITLNYRGPDGALATLEQVSHASGTDGAYQSALFNVHLKDYISASAKVAR